MLNFAFPAEAEIEDAESAGPMDGILEPQDIAESPMKRRWVDQVEVEREESMEEKSEVTEDRFFFRLLHLKEAKRKENWLRLPKEKRVAIRRLHAMMGHCSNAALIRMLKSSMAGQDTADAAKHFRCQSCEEMKRDEAPRVVRPTKPSCEVRFNYEVSVDVFGVHDAAEKRRSFLSVVDMATHYHAAFWVAPGGTPSSRVCAEAFNIGWLTPFGSPKQLTSDQGVHNSGRFASLLVAHGIEIRKTGARADSWKGQRQSRRCVPNVPGPRTISSTMEVTVDVIAEPRS